MKKMFDYNHFNDEVKDTLVESFGALVDSYMEGKSNTTEYQEANMQFSEDFMKECVSAIPNTTFEGMDMLKNPTIHTDLFFLHRFDTLLAQMITPVVPTIISGGYEELYDVQQVGWGNNAKYTVQSNELYTVNDAAIGVARGGVLTEYDTEYTVKAHKKEVGVYCDWYHVLAGKFDFGRFGYKIGLAYKMYIEGKVIKAMADLITNNTSPLNRDGIMGYIANGFTDANWLNVSENVRMANGGAQVYALGTKLALANVLPASASFPGSAFRMDENSILVKGTHLPSYKEVPLMELNQALLPNTINGTPGKVVSDNIIYMLPLGGYKPVKVVMEGTSLTVTKNPLEHADHTYSMHVNMMIGCDVVVGTKMGGIILP